MTFDLRQLRAFATIVAKGSLGRAADALHITQPALSRTIKHLEEQVGTPLFERHSKGMHLTEVGRALLPHAELLLREAERTQEQIDALLGLSKGTIRVGAVASIASLVLPTAIGNVLQKHPNLHVEIIEGVWDRLADALTQHEIDLALSTHIPDTEDIIAIPDCHWEDNSYIVASCNHPLRQKQTLQLADTLNEKWTIPPRGTTPFEQMQKLFQRNNLEFPKVVVETRSITVLKSLVARSGFLSWMAEPMYDIEKKAEVIDRLPVAGVTGKRALTAFRRRYGVLPAPAVRLLDELRKLTSTQ